MSELSGKKALLKELIKRLHAGANLEEVKREFRGPLSLVTPTEIAQLEEELIKEGMPKEEIQRMCDLHLAVFQESLAKEQTLAPAGHPIHILMTEHKLLLQFAEELRGAAKEIKGAARPEAANAPIARLNTLVGRFKASPSHYTREENVLFPYLEKHSITQPPAIMWMEHDKIREIEKGLYELVDARATMAWQAFVKGLEQAATALAEMLGSHFYKENNILFPTSLRVMGTEEWLDARKQFDELGYCDFTPPAARVPMPGMAAPTPITRPEEEEMITFETGSFSKEELETLLNTLPVDITFVDKEDAVRYFSEGKDRIFTRTKAVIGRKVQQCHPQKSLHVVNQILDDFRHGRRDVAEFWINLQGRLIYIRYFAVRSKGGEYLGCLEVTQDITGIKKIEGEKRLL